jgi:hypothetical protein
MRRSVPDQRFRCWLSNSFGQRFCANSIESIRAFANERDRGQAELTGFATLFRLLG